MDNNLKKNWSFSLKLELCKTKFEELYSLSNVGLGVGGGYCTDICRCTNGCFGSVQ